MAKLSPTKTPSGVLAIGTRPSWGSAALLRADSSTLLVLAADLQDPGNAGAVVRVAEAAGATGVWLTGESVDPFTWRALRGSMGGTFRLPVVRTGTTRDAIAACLARGVQVVATDGRASRTFYEVDLLRPTALLLGNEGGGLSKTLLGAVSAVVAIPMVPAVNSLNVATAAAVLLYEAYRQRAEASKS
jgi:TrmH family RNA methyltransferase